MGVLRTGAGAQQDRVSLKLIGQPVAAADVMILVKGSRLCFCTFADIDFHLLQLVSSILVIFYFGIFTFTLVHGNHGVI